MPALPTPQDGFEINPDADAVAADEKLQQASHMYLDILELFEEYQKLSRAQYPDLPKADFFLKLRTLQNTYKDVPKEEPFVSYKNILSRFSMYAAELAAAWNDFRSAKKTKNREGLQDVIAFLEDMESALGKAPVLPGIERKFPALRDVTGKIQSLRARSQNVLAQLPPDDTVQIKVDDAHSVPEDDLPSTAKQTDIVDTSIDLMRDELLECLRILQEAKASHPDNIAAHLVAVGRALEDAPVDPLERFAPHFKEAFAAKNKPLLAEYAKLHAELEALLS